MKILLYSPDNGVTRNFMPHLWMFLLQALTPPGNQVLLIDGNARAMSPDELVRFVRENGIGLVGIGAMTRMIAKAYLAAAALRAAGVPVVMGGPHVSALPGEALGRDGGPRYADAVAIGEADTTWPLIVADAERGALQEVYQLETATDGRRPQPALQPYPVIPWDTLDLTQFDLVPSVLRPLLTRFKSGRQSLHVIPVETGRGCPYGCDFCTVTGFFGDSIRFRSNESVIEELLRIKARALRDRGQIAVFFIDDNIAIKVSRTKALLRDIIAAGAQLPWVGQISANLLRDEELVDLIAASGGMWVFIGMESIDPVNLAAANKGFSKPDEYAAVLERLAQRNIYAICSFIFGMDNDTPGVADRTLEQIRRWPPGLPVFGQLTPYHGTPLYERLEKEGRLTRPKHWLEFAPFQMAHQPLKMHPAEVRKELDRAWTESYSPQRIAEAIDSIAHRPVGDRLVHLIARLFFHSIYFPQRSTRAWLRLVARNRRTIFRLVREGLAVLRARRKSRVAHPAPEPAPQPAPRDNRPSTGIQNAEPF